MSTINILFYSNFCEGSKLLITLMQAERLTELFHMICTDDNPKIPAHIRTTPTLIIRGLPTPYIGGDAFKWLSKVKQWKVNMMMQNMSSMQQQYMQNINNNLVADNSAFIGFSKVEMEGMSDIFAYLQGENAMDHSQVKCVNMGNDNIITPPLEDGSYKISNNNKYRITPQKQKELELKMKTERDKQDILVKQAVENFKKHYS
jgi:hypothetical protein